MARPRFPVRAIGLAALLVALPSTSAAAASSGGWSPLGHGATAGSIALNAKVETFTSVGSKLYVGGDFTNAGGIAAADGIAVWNGGWSAVGGGLLSTGSAVYAIAVDGSKVYAGGSFANAGGDANADGIAVWNGSAWHSLGNVALNGPVFALAIVGRTLYIGGAFDNAAGNPVADAVASYGLDSGTWGAITDGNRDIGGTVSSLVPDGGGGLFVGGNFIDADGIAQADFVADWTGGTSWVALGSNSGGANGALNNRVRGLAISGSDLYVVGDFTNVADNNAADKVAHWTGSAWAALGAGSFFGEGNVSLYAVALDGPWVFVGGGFVNANGQAKADGIAAFKGSSWTNVGTDAAGTNGPAPGGLFALRVVGASLYAGGLDPHIGGGSENAFAASFSLRRPDAEIATTGTYAGNGVYNATGKKQTKTLSIHRSKSGTFKLRFGNDGFVADSYTLGAPGSGGGFTATYLDGTTDVTAQVVAGTYHVNGLAPGSTKVLKLKVKVGSGVAVGASHTWLVTQTSTGSGSVTDAVKAKVKAT
jgi:hypothetical protein